ncbi:hypothetical protein GYMLUDRAFT_71416 [Collybiopsis luxurians FD-317 M1]|uniref:Uncharacterized protein n=1 Tax=Collybiopsis luxurians FD-317 M1 TaxID=944289 RepID=A0A0D0C713_9AGAR|nr:hypothetical protein GYMLUDRAFT_71416 [Collybiopsis luxurians FD-317 M1]
MSSTSPNLDETSEYISSLGLRQTNPPDSHPTSSSHLHHSRGSSGEGSEEPERKNSEDQNEVLSDAEWEIWTGRMIDILRNTLPNFFTTGLMTSWDPETGEAHSPRSLPSLPNLPSTLSSLPSFHLSPDPKGHQSRKGKERVPIFSPQIRLTYTPPTPLPHPFPEKLTIEGKPLYFTSAVFVRHTLNTLYSDLKVALIKVAVSVPKSHNRGTDRKNHPSPEDAIPEQAPGDKPIPNAAYKREKSLYIALRVTGTSRVTGSQSQWDVRSTYTFSPFTAQIILHTVNGIEPAPEKGVYDALYKALRLGTSVPFGGQQALVPCTRPSSTNRTSSS